MKRCKSSPFHFLPLTPKISQIRAGKAPNRHFEIRFPTKLVSINSQLIHLSLFHSYRSTKSIMHSNYNNAPMLRPILTLLSLLIIQSFTLIQSSIIPPPPPFNLSHFLFPKVTTFTESSIPPEPPNFLQGVLDGIASKEKWVLEDIRVSELDVKKAKYGSVQRYEFRVRIGKTEIVLKMYEEVMEWKRMAELSSNGTLDFETLVRKVSSKVVIDSFEIEGPLELRAVGKDDQLSLMLPLKTSHSGLKRISVGKGITVEVKGAEEISILHPIDRHKLPYGTNEACPALLPIQIMGSASIVAYRTKRPTAYIKTVFSSRETIELLSDKCYVWPNYQKPRHLLSSVVFLEKVLRSFLSENTALGFLKSRIRASTIFRFQLEVERYIRSNDTYWSTLAEWRTRPMFERVRFEVTARIEGEILKPLIVKKVRPFIDVDSFAWSSLLSNLSFTKFPSVLVPPEALTLDVKW